MPFNGGADAQPAGRCEGRDMMKTFRRCFNGWAVIGGFMALVIFVPVHILAGPAAVAAIHPVSAGSSGNRLFAPPADGTNQVRAGDDWKPLNPDGLWLETVGVSNGTVGLNLHHATNEVYAIWSLTDFSAEWDVETDVHPTNREVMPFTVDLWDRPNLFLRAQDWTAVDSDGDGLADWWEWENFGDLEVSGNDYDAAGDTLLYDYQHGIDPFDPDTSPRCLGYWRFDDTNTWAGEAGQLPLRAAKVSGVPSWNTNAVLVDGDSPAALVYRDMETNGEANINLRTGTVRFWFKPDWTSANQGGTGPQPMARLLEAGSYDPGFTDGWWALYLNSNDYGQTQITFGSSADGAGNTNLSARVFWASKRWHQIALTYSPTDAALYCDGELLATDTGDHYFPDAAERAAGFRIGADAVGGSQAGGVIEDLETFNYELSADDLAADYAAVPLPPPPTVTITYPVSYGVCLVKTNQPLLLQVDAQAAPGGFIEEVDYSYEIYVGDPPIGVATNSPFSFPWTNTDWRGQGYYITAVAVDNLGVASEPYTAAYVEIDLDSDGDGTPDWWMEYYFGHPTGEAWDHSLAGEDVDGDGASNLQEYQARTSPTDYNNSNWASDPEILTGGNNQSGNPGSFLPQPITVTVLDVDFAPLTNREVRFVMAGGTALLAVSTNDAPAASLALPTDATGEASVWVYFPPAGSNPPDSTVLISANGWYGMTTVAAHEYLPLARWHFEDTNTWAGEAGQLPLAAGELAGIFDWSSNAVVLDGAGPARLAYRVLEDNGSTNLDRQTGSVVFYFKPDWSSVDRGGTGPGTPGRLIEMGGYSPDFTSGWWSLLLNADGTQLMFATAANGVGLTNLAASISWNSNAWHQIALTYSPDSSALFVDGTWAASGAGVTNCPDADELAKGFNIGSDADGNHQARGAFDELATFASPLTGALAPAETCWTGIPDYQANAGGTLTPWLLAYFGHLGVDPDGDFDNDGTNNLQEFLNGTDPNKISFSFSVPHQYVTNRLVDAVITVLGGVPSSTAVLVDDTNFAGATWTAYASSNITVDVGSSPGAHDVWIGLRGRRATSCQAWEETTLVLNSVAPTIAISSPADGAAFNASRVNVTGNVAAATLRQITVNNVPALVDGTNFEARNVPLAAGANVITAVVEDRTGMTNAVSIAVTGLTNVDGSMNAPVQLQAAPVAGFAPLPVTFSVSANVPGTIQQVSYDFNGDGIADLATNNLDALTYPYATNGEYFPVVTVQTEVGRFSSVGGWNAAAVDPGSQPVRINVQSQPVQATLAAVQDPVDLKWDGTHVYVLSGSGGAVYEFATDGSTIRSVNVGGHPSGLDVDGAGNVYVAVTAGNQVWKFNPTEVSFQADTNFGVAGCIGSTNGTAGTGTNEFNAPYDVAVSPDGQTISVSDTGNHRIQQFSAANGAFVTGFGSQGNQVGQFNAPQGLTYDASGTLYIADFGNNRMVLAEGSAVMDATGGGGSELGQFNGLRNVSVGKRGVYAADTGNNRIQKFGLPAQGTFSITADNVDYALGTGLSAPAAVAAVDHLTNELFYVADTGHNRVLLCRVPDHKADEIQAVWNNMVTRVVAGDIAGAAQCFSSRTADGYRQAFLAMGQSYAVPIMNQIGELKPVSIDDDLAQYYFEQSIAGLNLTFPVEFIKEDSGWKILEF